MNEIGETSGASGCGCRCHCGGDDPGEEGACRDEACGCGCNCGEEEEECGALRWAGLGVAGCSLVLLLAAPLGTAARAALLVAGMLAAGLPVFRVAARNLVRLRPLEENSLMALASLGAAALGDWPEAVAVLLFYRVGEAFEDAARDRSRRDVLALVDRRPDSARVLRGGVATVVKPGQLEPGDEVEVRPGERVPADGEIVSGSSSLDCSALTGESLPRDVGPGDSVASGCVNLSGALRVAVRRRAAESTAARVLALVETSAARKSRPERFVRRFARVYTPAVCALAAALAALGPLACMTLGRDPQWGEWARRALVALVTSCPCALVVGVPLAFFAGIGGAGRGGVLVKGGAALEALARVRTVAFDKTGTLTRGAFDVAGVHHADRPEAELVRLAARAEAVSPHPAAAALRRAAGLAGEGAAAGAPPDARENPGLGATATVDGARVAVGNARLMEREGARAVPCREPGTVVHVAVDGGYAGYVLLRDEPRAGAAEAVAALRAACVRRVEMLTGDRPETARAVAGALALDGWAAELSPAGKVERLETLLAEKPRGSAVAFVGDGLNDAAALARADVGLAMGGLGSDAALETADAVIMDDDPRKAAFAVRHARRCLRIVRQDVALAIGVKAACLALGAAGLAGLWAAVFADVGVLVLCVLNALRCFSAKAR